MSAQQDSEKEGCNADMGSARVLKGLVKRTPLYPLLASLQERRTRRVRAEAHRMLHNDNPLFYPLSPMLLIGIAKAFDMQRIEAERGKNLLDEHAYYEFGLFKGFSFWFAEQISRGCTNKDFRFYGFDSFEGLPDSQVDKDPVYWAAGNYAASIEFVSAKLKENGSDLSRMRLYKGWFSKQLA